MKEVVKQLKTLYESWAKEEALSIVPLAPSGSYRKYLRINGKEKTAIGVFNPDKKENRAFITFTGHFIKKGLNVPHLYAQNLKDDIYLIEDLGDTTLFSLVENEKSEDKLPNIIVDYYKDALNHLIKFQIDGGKGLDYSVCYPRDKFDKQSILWDLNYFKYYFLKLTKIPFDEQKLIDEAARWYNLLNDQISRSGGTRRSGRQIGQCLIATGDRHESRKRHRHVLFGKSGCLIIG